MQICNLEKEMVGFYAVSVEEEHTTETGSWGALECTTSSSSLPRSLNTHNSPNNKHYKYQTLHEKKNQQN